MLDKFNMTKREVSLVANKFEGMYNWITSQGVEFNIISDRNPVSDIVPKSRIMKLKYKYFIGTQVMFYEIEVVNEFIHSLYRASEGIENPENITVDMCFNISEFFEKVDTEQISKEDLINRFKGYLKPLEDLGVDVRLEIYDDMAPKTMTDYRRDINYFVLSNTRLCNMGQSDCLFPVQIFEVLDGLMDYIRVTKYLQLYYNICNQKNVGCELERFRTR